MRTCLPMLSVLMFLTACNDGVSVFDPHTHSHSSVSGVREGSWPPEPVNMENEQRLPTELRARSRRSVVDIARRAVMNHPELLAAIGNDYGTYDAAMSTSKTADVASFIFYNYDTDQTVEAMLGIDGAVSVRSQPASTWQPTENALEVEQAVSLARASLEADGHTLETLTGTAMLTYPQRNPSADNTPMFYDSRMLYVTFGFGDGEPPLYSARVDLSSRVISEGGAIR
mgnify:CR=1 FL=1